MQITLNQTEVEQAISKHVESLFNLEWDEPTSVTINEDGTAVFIVGEEVSHEDDTPPVVEKKTRRSRKNPLEAKHRPVDPTPEPEVKEEIQTSTGGQNENSTPEPEAQGEPEETTGTEELKEEATAEAEAAASQEVAEEAAVQEKVQEKAVETTAAKPSLFANLKR